MGEINYTTEHRKGQHLTSEERHIIEVRWNKDKRSIYGIAKELGRPYNTVKNEIMRSTVLLYNGKVRRYKADIGYSVYLEHRQECRRKYRCLETVAFLQKVKNHSAKAVDEALDELFATFGDKYLEVFKTITSDNGSEFANLSRLEEKGIGIYFTHPYTSCEKGTVECHNRMLRRFISKGKSIDDYSADEIMIFADIMNALPRKLLGYHTPEELFDAELDRIYAV